MRFEPALSNSPTRSGDNIFLAAPPAERVQSVRCAKAVLKHQTASLGIPPSLLLPIPFDSSHKGAAKVGRTPLSGGDQDQKMIARAMRRGARGI